MHDGAARHIAAFSENDSSSYNEFSPTDWNGWYNRKKPIKEIIPATLDDEKHAETRYAYAMVARMKNIRKRKIIKFELLLTSCNNVGQSKRRVRLRSLGEPLRRESASKWQCDGRKGSTPPCHH
jgi:hypothetical protein